MYRLSFKHLFVAGRENLLTLKERAFQAGSFSTFLFLDQEMKKIYAGKSMLAAQRLDLGTLYSIIYLKIYFSGSLLFNAHGKL